jgi:hypothetical protein
MWVRCQFAPSASNAARSSSAPLGSTGAGSNRTARATTTMTNRTALTRKTPSPTASRGQRYPESLRHRTYAQTAGDAECQRVTNDLDFFETSFQQKIG